MLDNPPTPNRNSFATPDEKEIYGIALAIGVTASWLRVVRFDYLEYNVAEILRVVGIDP